MVWMGYLSPLNGVIVPVLSNMGLFGGELLDEADSRVFTTDGGR